MSVPGSLMDQIKAAVKRLTVDGKTPPLGVFLAMFPHAAEGYVAQAYRSGRAATVLPDDGPDRPLPTRTAADMAAIHERVARMRAWKISQGEIPVGYREWTVPRSRKPVRLEQLDDSERGAA